MFLQKEFYQKKFGRCVHVRLVVDRVASYVGVTPPISPLFDWIRHTHLVFTVTRCDMSVDSCREEMLLSLSLLLKILLLRHLLSEKLSQKLSHVPSLLMPCELCGEHTNSFHHELSGPRRSCLKDLIQIQRYRAGVKCSEVLKLYDSVLNIFSITHLSSRIVEIRINLIYINNSNGVILIL